MITNDDSVTPRRVDDALTIVPLFDGTNFSFDVAKAVLSGSHPPVVNRISDRVYYFLEGEATVTIGDKEHNASSGDLAVIKAGTQHAVDGTAKYLVITAPPFDPANERIVDG